MPAVRVIHTTGNGFFADSLKLSTKRVTLSAKTLPTAFL